MTTRVRGRCWPSALDSIGRRASWVKSRILLVTSSQMSRHPGLAIVSDSPGGGRAHRRVTIQTSYSIGDGRGERVASSPRAAVSRKGAAPVANQDMSRRALLKGGGAAL